MKEIKSFVISRKKWGKGINGGKLYRERTGLSCCLGLYLQACGIPKEEMIATAYPHDAVQLPNYSWLLDVSVMRAIATQNDDLRAADDLREISIAELFEHYGNVRVTFED